MSLLAWYLQFSEALSFSFFIVVYMCIFLEFVVSLPWFSSDLSQLSRYFLSLSSFKLQASFVLVRRETSSEEVCFVLARFLYEVGERHRPHRVYVCVWWRQLENGKSFSFACGCDKTETKQNKWHSQTQTTCRLERSECAKWASIGFGRTRWGNKRKCYNLASFMLLLYLLLFQTFLERKKIENENRQFKTWF